jgi:uncharacterized protein
VSGRGSSSLEEIEVESVSIQATGWRSAVIEYIRREALPVDKYGHQPRLYALTRLIGEGMSYDDDVVFAAVWMHDLGVFIGHRPEDPVALGNWDNVIYAAERTPALLTEFGFPPEKILAVIDAIRTHQAQKDPRSIEATIVRDADILEQLGAVGILRAVSKVGRDTRYPTFSAIVPYLRKALETLPPLLRLESARALATPRVRLLNEFLTAVNAEAGDALN